MSDSLTWFGVKSLYRHRFKEDGRIVTSYEERVVMFLAKDPDEAIAMAEKEAREYASRVGVEYLDFVNGYATMDETIEHGSEIYSLLRDSALSPKDYIDKFHDDGNQRCMKSE